jgi:hypothetical protein
MNDFDATEKSTLHKKIKDSGYTTYHSMIYRHIDYFLGQALDHNHEALYTMDEIRKLVEEKSSIFFHGGTIERYNRNYKEKHGESPLCQVGDKYRLNQCYYSYARIKPPRPHKSKIQL